MKQNLPILTGLRFLAAFYVFIFHAHLRLSLDFLPRFAQNIIGQGAIGVNVFFILSGFILYYNYVNREVNYKEFIYKRLAKIYPVYLFGFILCLGVVYLLNSNIDHYFRIKIYNLLLIQSYFPKYSMEWYGGGSWSISTEFFFYLLFPFLLKSITKLDKTKTVLLVLLTYFFSIIPGLLFNLGIIPINWNYTFPPSRLPEFFIGMLTAVLIYRFNTKVSNKLIASIILLCCVYYVLIGKDLQGYVIQNIIVIPLVTIFLIGVTTFKNSIFSFLGTKLFEYLGKISYSFYITQIPIFLYLDKNFIFKNYNSLFYLIIVFVLNLFLSMIAYHIIEKPIHQFLIDRLKKRKQLKNNYL
ncbi:MAG: acyltransferase [Bacteroidetes bacterium]|nr:acyltransferase [Bacteroidota bacterium]